MAELNIETLNEIINEARTAANKAANEYLSKELNGIDQYACGFAWVDIQEYNDKRIRGNSKIGKLLKAAGVDQNYNRVFQIWNPSGLSVQNIDVKEFGARAAVEVFRKYGFKAYAGGRLD